MNEQNQNVRADGERNWAKIEKTVRKRGLQISTAGKVIAILSPLVFVLGMILSAIAEEVGSDFEFLYEHAIAPEILPTFLSVLIVGVICYLLGLVIFAIGATAVNTRGSSTEPTEKSEATAESTAFREDDEIPEL